jgi:hypothetical protein
MKFKLFNLWINLKPFRSIWILPLFIGLLFLILMIVLGNSESMNCEWSPRDRWECIAPVSENS